jgi:hypothetical protein
MKRITIILFCLACITMNSNGQAREIQQLLLNWEKLKRLEEILDNLYRGYKILDKGYNTIKDIAEGNYKIHDLFLDGLMAVNPAVRNYKRIPFILDYQQMLLREYKRAYNRFRQDPNFTEEEIQYLALVYGSLFDASLKNLDELLMIITAAKLRMSDDESTASSLTWRINLSSCESSTAVHNCWPSNVPNHVAT